VRSAEPTATPTFAARLDGNPWYIKHEVKTSSYRDAQPGDLLTRIYTVTYRCPEPPCDASVKSDDPDTIAPATANPFTFRDGAYVSSETYRERCVTADGVVIQRAYLVDLTTTIRVTAAELEGGELRATAVEGSQVRNASAGSAAASCPDWRIEHSTTGTRNVQPGIATDFVSSNWAGYIAEPREGRVTHVQGSWVQPAIACPDLGNRFASFWIGIDGFRSETVEQLGTLGQCVGGRPSYAAWWEMYPDPAVEWDMAVHPGDEFSATIDVEGDDFTMTLQNITTGETRTTTQSGPGVERSSAEWIAEPPYVCYTDGSCELAVLSDFGRVRFDDAFAAIDGGPSLPITDPAWQLARDNIETEAGRRVAETSTLSSDGTSFTVNWRPDR
jgi:hypothetical protein